MADPVYNLDEKHVLKLATHFRDMVETEWWREFEALVKAQIRARELVLLTPLGDQNPAFEGLDFMSRAVKMEAIKGAIIGLRLAISIPSDTINHAAEIRAEHSPVEEHDNG